MVLALRQFVCAENQLVTGACPALHGIKISSSLTPPVVQIRIASHVERQVSVYRRIKRADALKLENLRHTQRELSWFEDDDGSWVFKGRFTAEQGVVIGKALEAAMEQLFIEQKNIPDDVSAETSRSQPLDQPVPHPIASRRADALSSCRSAPCARLSQAASCPPCSRARPAPTGMNRSNANNPMTSTINPIITCSRQRSRFCGNAIEVKSRNQGLGLNITAKTPVPSWLGERMDYSIAVEGLLRRE